MFDDEKLIISSIVGECFDSRGCHYYMRARYYSPATGIFLSEDPIRDGLNWYTYCTNDPLNFIDPDGTDPFRQKHYHEAATVAWQARKESGIDSMFIGMIPIVGDAKDIQEATTGVDLVTGEKLSKLDRGFTVVAAMLPVVNGKMARTGLDMGGEAASIVAKNMDGVLKGVDDFVTGVGKVDINKALETAQQAHKGGETIAGHALQKHAGRNPNIWGSIKGGAEQINQQSMKHIDDIINGSGEFKTFTTDRGVQFWEKMLSDGRGMRLNLDGTFKGFIDQMK